MAEHEDAHSDDAHGHDEHGDDHGHGGVKQYMAVFGGLCVLTAISFWLGNSPIKETAPGIAWAGMMAVSCCKALLVMLFFMHLIWEANWKYVLTIPASIMSIFLMGMLSVDIGLRTWFYSQERWLHAADPQIEQVDHGHHAEHPEGDGHDHKPADPGHP